MTSGRTLPAERTSLAWTRTGLAAAANGAFLLLRTLTGDASVADGVLVVAAFAVAGVAVVLGQVRSRRWWPVGGRATGRRRCWASWSACSAWRRCSSSPPAAERRTARGARVRR